MNFEALVFKVEDTSFLATITLLVKASNWTYPGGRSSQVSIVVLHGLRSKFTNWALLHMSSHEMLGIRTCENIIIVLEPTEIILHPVH